MKILKNAARFSHLIEQSLLIMNIIKKTIAFLKPALIILFFISFEAFAQGDDCANALALTNLSNFCSANGAFTTLGATTSANTTPTCWGNVNNDVWFKFTAVGADVVLTINGNTVNNNGSLANPNLALYSGACGALSQLGCAVMAFTLNAVTFYYGNLTIGNIYFVRVNGNNTGTFQLCINNFLAPATNNQDCVTASNLCSKDPISVNAFNGPGSNQNEVTGSCIPSESQSNWYTWRAADSGTLTLTIAPHNQTDDIDFFVFELTGGDCSNKNVIRCCSSSCLGPEGSTGLSLTETDSVEDPGCIAPSNAYVKYIDITAGLSYGILINNFSGQGGYNLSFGGTGNFQGPVPDFTVSDTMVCDLKTQITFTNTSTEYSDLLWHFGSDASIDSTSATNPQVVSFNTFGPHTVALEVWDSSGCHVISYQTIMVLPEPSANLGKDTIICPGQSLLFNVSTLGANYLWQDSSTISTFVVSFTGLYWVEIMNICGSASDSIFVEAKNVLADFMYEPIPCSNQIQFLNLSKDTLSCHWDFGDGTTSNEYSPSHTYQTNGQYDVIMIINLHATCADTMQAVIPFENDAFTDTLFIPNVFTPNGDGKNDYFEILEVNNSCINLNRLAIFNRWGKKVFEAEGSQRRWDGTRNGQVLDDGTYFYMLEGQGFRRSGSITLLR